MRNIGEFITIYQFSMLNINGRIANSTKFFCTEGCPALINLGIATVIGSSS